MRIFVPSHITEDREVIGRCLVPGCDARFYAGEETALSAHNIACFKRHEAEILAAAPSRNRTIEHPDPEIATHMRRVGERMRREGRWTLHDNERAGFS